MLVEFIPPEIQLLYLLVISLIVGSFITMLSHRLPLMIKEQWKKEALTILDLEEPDSSPTPLFNLFSPASHCPQCHHPLKWYFNLPIFGYFISRRHCVQCLKAIPLRYLLIESLTLLLSVFLYLHFDWSSDLYWLLPALWLLTTLVVIDIEHQLLPDTLNYCLLWLGLLANSLGFGYTSPKDAIIGAVLGYLFFWFLLHAMSMITGRKGLGYGDLKLLAAIGAWVGWQNLPFVALISSFSALTYVLICFPILGKSVIKNAVPFGPFLALGFFIVICWRETLLNWLYQLT